MADLVVMLLFLILMSFPNYCSSISKSYFNKSMPSMRPTFVVNFDMSTVICQHTLKSTDLHLHRMSILCNGKIECLDNQAMHDEIFPYCAGECSPECSANGACLYDGETAHCYCNAGFHGPNCELADENECVDKPCNWLAHCRNTYGSYDCSCFPGFEGDGYQCADIDECETGLAQCPENSACVNLPGTYLCNCTQGFAPKGLPPKKCIDVDECAQGLDDCSRAQLCQNELGSFRCVENCDIGHELIAGICRDTNECVSGDNSCNPRAICTNTLGSYECTCEGGFEGNGRTCKPIVDCSLNEAICDLHAFCQTSLKLCICQFGYIGDGITCYDVDECQTRFDVCHIGSRCLNIEAGFLCCPPGIDDDQCIQNEGAFCPGGCGLHAECENRRCRCLSGFEGDPRKRCSGGTLGRACDCLTLQLADVNECEDMPNICPGVSEWCVNDLGGFHCCGPRTDQQDCIGLEISSLGPAINGMTPIETFTKLPVVKESSLLPIGSAIEKVNPILPDDATEGGHAIEKTPTEVENEEKFSTTFESKMEMDTYGCASSNDCGNDSFCEKRTGVCRCKPGFDGLPIAVPCKDVDECASSMHECLGSSKCSNYVGGYTCLCDLGGYRRGADGICTDIDECQERSPCHKNAICINLPASYTCSCSAGHTGQCVSCNSDS